MRNNEVKNETDEIKIQEEKIKRKDLKYKKNKYMYDFQHCKTIRCFRESIFTGKINIDEAEMDQSNLIENMVNLIINLGQNEKKKKRYS